jgi:phenylacetate-coenzyme A ligase PaaK-like adenylate-forming protein
MAIWTTWKCAARSSASCPANCATDIQAISKELQHRIKTLVGVSTLVSVMEFDTIPRTQVGKARRVLDERRKQN